MGRKKIEIITKTEFARRMEVTKGAITNAIARGNIFGDAITEDGKLVFEIARQQYEFNRTERGRKKKSQLQPAPPTRIVVTQGSNGAAAADQQDWTYRKATAQTKKAIYDALQAELNYRKSADELIERKIVEAVCYKIAKHLSDSLRNLPERYAQKTYAAYQAGGSEDDVRDTMRIEIDTILHTLAGEVKRFEL